MQEDEVSGRVRVNVMDRATGKYLKDVHVKVIGSENTDFLSGETDLLGKAPLMTRPGAPQRSGTETEVRCCTILTQLVPW